MLLHRLHMRKSGPGRGSLVTEPQRAIPVGSDTGRRADHPSPSASGRCKPSRRRVDPEGWTRRGRD